ncbi:S8 family peptidase [Thauera aromatica]|uniref:S8 family peptidase n=1 Tax=Thauera aromatica TaxID=59405 RepID=UPI00131BE3C9|nr:S8 family peptidase [Thauera aromatica]
MLATTMPAGAQETGTRRLGERIDSLLQRHGFPPRPSRPFDEIRMTAAMADASLLQARASARAVGLIVRFRDPAVQALAAADAAPPPALLAVLQAALVRPIRFQRAMGGGMHVLRFDTLLTQDEAESEAHRLRALPQVMSADVDLVSRPQQARTSTDPQFAKQWSLLGTTQGFAGGIDAEAAWTRGTGSSSVVVAVLDSGIRPHPEFGDRILPGYDFVSDPDYANDGNGRDADPADPGDRVGASECGIGEPAQPSTWHGTHVTGIIAADGANGIGIAGVTWKTRILPVRVLGKCGGTTSDILDGLRWALGLPVPGVPTNLNPAQILNLSLGGTPSFGCLAPYRAALAEAQGQGALVVVAAGNDSSTSAIFSPANCADALPVVATDPFGDLASYSNYGRTGLGAPGGDSAYFGPTAEILSTVDIGNDQPLGPDYGYAQGTSMAAPHVSGIAALMLATNPQLSGTELRSLLEYGASAYPVGSYCAYSNLCGTGLANAHNSVSTAAAMLGYQLVHEFHNTDLQHYFLTGSKDEAALIEKGSAGPGWTDTREYFYAWSRAVDGAAPVCRFYGTPGIGPNSHFYTASAQECDLVKLDPGWTYEGIAFYARLPTEDACPVDTIPVFRSYNMRWMLNDSNHRYTTDEAIYQQMNRSGWVGEGVALCVAA